MTMTRNVGRIDKIVRIVVGIALLSLTIFLEGNAKWWGLIGLVPLATAITRWCPSYAIFGVSTCSPGEPQKQA